LDTEETLAILKAYWAGDHARIAPDATYVEMSTGAVWHGRGAISAMVDEFYAVTFDAEFETAHMLVGDGRAVLEGEVVGVQKLAYAGIEPSGRPVRMPMCISYELSNGHIQHARLYTVTEALRREREGR
jgi:hypothetical protein